MSWCYLLYSRETAGRGGTTVRAGRASGRRGPSPLQAEPCCTGDTAQGQDSTRPQLSMAPGEKAAFTSYSPTSIMAKTRKALRLSYYSCCPDLLSKVKTKGYSYKVI